MRVEQLYPFPKKEIQSVLARYRKAREICWVQEEPRNRGAWSFMEDRLREMLPDPAVLNYFGRDASASPATGSPKMHIIEENEIISHALDIRVKEEVPPSPVPAAAQTAVVPAAVASPRPGSV